ncbi:hypothetical protein CCACVL1_21294, partial [Corchorus capsularis]
IESVSWINRFLITPTRDAR